MLKAMSGSGPRLQGAIANHRQNDLGCGGVVRACLRTPTTSASFLAYPFSAQYLCPSGSAWSWSAYSCARVVAAFVVSTRQSSGRLRLPRLSASLASCSVFLKTTKCAMILRLVMPASTIETPTMARAGDPAVGSRSAPQCPYPLFCVSDKRFHFSTSLDPTSLGYSAAVITGLTGPSSWLSNTNTHILCMYIASPSSTYTDGIRGASMSQSLYILAKHSRNSESRTYTSSPTDFT